MTQTDLDKVKRAVIRKYPITAGLALHDVDVELSTEVGTAAVVGEKDDKGVIHVKCIKANPEFFDKLSFSERVFVLAHESLHIAFKHFARSIQKPEKDAQKKYEEYCEKESDPAKRERMREIYHRRYQNMWNIATDACINALLRKDGFTFPQNIIDSRTGEPMEFVDMEEGFHKCAEAIYDYLYQQQEEKEQQQNQQGDQSNQDNSTQNDQNSQEQDTNEQKSQGGGGEQGEQNNQEDSKSFNSENESNEPSPFDDIDIDNYRGFDSHESWTGEEQEKNLSNQKNNSSEESKEQKDNEGTNDSEEINEEEIMQEEKKQRQKKAGEKPSKDAFGKLRKAEGIGEYVPVKPVISWKRLLEGTLEKEVEVWGNRRSSRYNPNPRIEERTVESRASAEVLLDVSGSVSIDLLKGFLLQLYPIFEEMSGDEEIALKVGCFSTKFSGWTVIKNKKDIENFSPYIGGGTDFELAATAFSKDKSGNTTKIVFTDGCLGYPQTTRVSDVIWIVFGDEMDFVPVGGRIIKVSEKEYKEMISHHLLHEEELKEDSNVKSI